MILKLYQLPEFGTEFVYDKWVAVLRTNDVDLDTICGGKDNCPDVANMDQDNFDKDPFGDECEVGALLADINNSTRVDGFDLAALGLAMGREFPNEGYSAAADLNRNGINDGTDLDLLTRFFGLDTE